MGLIGSLLNYFWMALASAVASGNPYTPTCVRWWTANGRADKFAAPSVVRIGTSVSVVRVPQVSVFTPSHRSGFLDDCYASLAAQTFADWEWVVVLNAGAVWTPPDDARVHLHRGDALTGVGAVKRRACELATGEILVECDHDDVLASTALAEIVEAFADPP